MATTYYADISIPGRDLRVVSGPVDSIAEVAKAYYDGCSFLVERGELDPNEEMPTWQPYAEVDGERRRPFTDIEHVALATALERN